MSFLLEVDAADEQLLVTEILALLDVDDDIWSDVAVEKPHTRTTLPRKQLVHSLKAESPRARRGRRPASPQPRLRNKGKIELLRREIVGLEEELAQLQQRPGADQKANSEKQHAESLWKVIAAKQSQEREQAEERNKALKRLLTTQYALTSSLSGVLTEWTSLPPPESTSVCI